LVKRGDQEGLPVPLPSSGEGVRGWGEMMIQVFLISVVVEKSFNI
jgi:hypothetical protein